MIRRNYHTHTMRCHHAYASDEEMVLAAIRGGYETLGFSDHACWKYDSDFKSHIRMELSEFDEYFESISHLREKYKDRIQILIGLECEYFPRYMEWLENFVKEKKLDYIILGNHYIDTDEKEIYYGRCCQKDEMLKRYVDDCIAGMSTGLYSYLAHPDLFMRGRESFDEFAKAESYRLCRWCKDHQVILEYNLEGVRMCRERGVSWYPDPEFWKIVSLVGNDVIIGVDAHYSASLADSSDYEEALKFLKGLNLNVVEEIPCRF